jgi:hypothetical protein
MEFNDLKFAYLHGFHVGKKSPKGTYIVCKIALFAYTLSLAAIWLSSPDVHYATARIISVDSKELCFFSRLKQDFGTRTRTSGFAATYCDNLKEMQSLTKEGYVTSPARRSREITIEYRNQDGAFVVDKTGWNSDDLQTLKIGDGIQIAYRKSGSFTWIEPKRTGVHIWTYVGITWLVALSCFLWSLIDYRRSIHAARINSAQSRSSPSPRWR